MNSIYPAFEEMFLETYSLLTKHDRAVLDASLINIRQLREQKPPSPHRPLEEDEAEEVRVLDMRIDAMEQRLYTRIRVAMERM